MDDLDARLDLATLAFLAGSAANDALLQLIRRGGHSALRISHGYVFQRLVAGEPTVGELSRALGVSQQAASKAIAELETLGYVERRGDTSDRRVTRLALTDAGAEAVAVARRARADLERAVADRVGAADLAAAHRVLTALLMQVDGEKAVRNRSVRPTPP
ncbi:MAG: MarR family transcriptional regulator [Actinomycetota bacterium]|nr:MarR family transcriptional regulator [Actinomycetota bacterium]